MMIEIKAPNIVPDDAGPKIFIAGSIEMGKAAEWQAQFVEGMRDCNCVIVNPRRDDWDSGWLQTIENVDFKEQVEWELHHIKTADVVIFYFDPWTRSPITMMELGYACNDPANVAVCCPVGFWRKGNVDIICSVTGIQMVDTLAGLIEFARSCVDQLNISPNL